MWVAFLTRNELFNKDDLPKELENTDLRKALTVLEIMNFSDEENEAYEDHLKWLRIETNTLKNYEQKGWDKGLKKGLEQGLEQGLKQVAKNLLKNGMNIKDVACNTGLPEEQIQKLI